MAKNGFGHSPEGDTFEINISQIKRRKSALICDENLKKAEFGKCIHVERLSLCCIWILRIFFRGF